MSDNNPKVSIDMLEYTRQVANAAAEKSARMVINEHIASCPVLRDTIRIERQQQIMGHEVDRLKLRLATLIGLMGGAGGIGGIVGGGIVNMLGS